MGSGAPNAECAWGWQNKQTSVQKQEKLCVHLELEKQLQNRSNMLFADDSC